MTNEEQLKLIHSRCTEEGDCWLWDGALDGHGRPQKRHNGKTVYVRRLVRELIDGPIPASMVVAAKCGTKRCISPTCSCTVTHTKKAQMAAVRGAFNSPAKLAKMVATKRAASWITEEMVRQIRHATVSSSQIAAEMNVSESHVKAIRRGTARREASNPFGGLLRSQERRAA